jgi:hypothetical protein
MEIFAIHVWIKVSNSKNSPERFLSRLLAEHERISTKAGISDDNGFYRIEYQSAGPHADPPSSGRDLRLLSLSVFANREVSAQTVERVGASEGIRTLDTHVGNVMLYQAELRSRPKSSQKLREFSRNASPVFLVHSGHRVS